MISKWKLKAVVQKGISILPRPERTNFFFQKYITKGVSLTDEHFGFKIRHAKDHIDYLKKYAEKRTDNIVLELGTGWYPIIPLVFYLSDAGRIISVDIQKWLTLDRQFSAIQKMKEWRDKGKLEDYFDQLNEKKWEKLMQILEKPEKYTKEQINEIIGLEYLIQDARKLEFKDNTIDFVISNNTFEHIREDHLGKILLEFKRVVKTDGMMSHFIDCSDHFAHFDRSINIYNFLKFSKKRWRLIDNSIQPQNRLRIVDFRKLYADLDIPITEEAIVDGDVSKLHEVKIHKEFAQYTDEELAASHAYLVSRFNEA